MEVFNFNAADVKGIKMMGTDTHAICKFLEDVKIFFNAKGFSHFTHPFEEGSEEFASTNTSTTEGARLMSENVGKIANFFCSVLHEKFEKLYKQDIWKGEFKKVLRAINAKVNPIEKRMFHLMDLFFFIQKFEKAELKEGFIEEEFSDLNLAIGRVAKDMMEMTETEREETYKKACLKYTDKRKNTNKFVDVANWSEKKLQNYLDVEYERFNADKVKKNEETKQKEAVNVTMTDEKKNEDEETDGKIDKKWLTEQINNLMASKNSKKAEDTQATKVFGGKKRTYDQKGPYPQFKFNRAHSGPSRFNPNFNMRAACYYCGSKGHFMNQCDLLGNGNQLAQRLQARGAVANNSEYGLPVSQRVKDLSNFNDSHHYLFVLLYFIYLLHNYLIGTDCEKLLARLDERMKVKLKLIGSLDNFETWIQHPHVPIGKWLRLNNENRYHNVDWVEVFERLFLANPKTGYRLREVERITALYVNTGHREAIFDTGATSHMTDEDWNFERIRHCDVLVKTANSEDSMIVKKRGDLGVLKDILITKLASSNIISSSKLEQEGMMIVIKDGIVQIKDKQSNEIICCAEARQGLYVFREIELNKLTKYNSEIIRSVMIYEENDLLRLHRKLNHMDMKKLKKAIKENDFIIEDPEVRRRILNDDILPCRVCISVKPRMRPIPRQPSLHHGPLMKIGLDFKGYFPPSVCDGFTCCFIFVDYTTDYTFVYLSKSGECAGDAIHACAIKVLSLGFRIQFIQTDSALMFKSFKCKSVMRNLLIQHQESAPYSQWQNGKVERHIGTIFGYARSLLTDSNAPIDCWDQALLHAVQIRNHTPKSNGESSPMFFLKRQVLEVQKLPYFYQLGSRMLPEDQVNTSLGRRSVQTRFLGFFNDFPGSYVCLDEGTRKKVIVAEARTSFSIGPPPMNTEISPLPPDFDGRVNAKIYQKGQGPQEETEEIVTKVLEIVSNEVDEVEQGQQEKPKEEKTNVWRVPKSITEALSGPMSAKWFEALCNERNNFEKYKTFAPCSREELERLRKEDITGTMVVFAQGVDNTGEDKLRARLVGRGDQQVGIHKDELYAATTPAEINKMLLNCCIAAGLMMLIFDVSAAFLEGRNDRLQYARLPKFFADGVYGDDYSGERIVRVIGNFYGFRQAPRIWAELFKNILTEYGFMRSLWIDTLYYFFTNKGRIIISTHVDDALLLYDNEEMVEELKSYLATRVKGVKYTRDFTKFLGIELDVNQNNITLRHTNYIMKRYGHLTANNIPTLNQKMTDPSKKDRNGDLLKHAGGLRFIVDRGRPDLLSHVNELSSGDYPDALQLFQQVEGYLKTTANDGIQFKASREMKLFCFCDASLIKTGDSKSRVGGSYFINMKSGAFHNFSTKVSSHFSLVSTSSCEVELKGIYEVTVRGLTFLNVLKELKMIEENAPLQVFTDNQPAMKVLMKGSFNHEIRLINNRVRRMQEWIAEGQVRMNYVPSYLNVADMLTKCNLTQARFKMLTGILLNGVSEVPALEKLVRKALEEEGVEHWLED